jgi:molybdopterin-biosynthesis enzyme MoeA-like protein
VSAAVPGAKGSALSAGGEISAVTAVKDEVGTVSRQLREASQRLSQVI